MKSSAVTNNFMFTDFNCPLINSYLAEIRTQLDNIVQRAYIQMSYQYEKNE